jgi:hypothetical protein
MVKVTLIDLAISSILHDVLPLLSWHLSIGHRATGFKVFLESLESCTFGLPQSGCPSKVGDEPHLDPHLANR